LPISYLAPDQSAVFGFTAGTGAAAETGEVDNLVVSRLVPGPANANWQRCEANGDGARDVSDAVFVLAWLFTAGSAPACEIACDCNADGSRDISDPIFDLTYQFLGGPAPAAPYPACEPFEGCPEACR